MSVVFHVSDTHFGSASPEVVEASVELAGRLRPDVLVFSGDITQRARRGEFDAAKDWVERLAIPARVVIPGNHDIPLFNLAARVIAPYGGYSRVFGADLEPEHLSSDLMVLGVNTTRPRRHTDGEVSPSQVDRVCRRLRAATTGQLRVVVTHQPVHVIRESDITNRVRGAEGAIRAWASAGVDLILGGHIHLPYIRPLSERYGDLTRPVWCVQAGTAVSTRIRNDHANSINVIRHTAQGGVRRCDVQRFDFQPQTARFAMVLEKKLEFDG